MSNWGAMAQQSSYVKEMHIHSGANMSIFGNLKNVDSTLYNDGHLTMIGDSLINEAPIEGQGTLEMLGDVDQHITHKGIIIVDSLILNNTLDISFDNDIFVNKHASFINGILYDKYDASYDVDSMPSVTFSETAGYDSLLVGDFSHVDGLVKKQGKTRFIFPIGDANFYRPAIVDGVETETTISARYYYEWIQFPQDEVQFGVELYRDEFWYISGGDKSYDITLTYDTRTSTFDSDETDIKIVSYDENHDISYRINDAEPVSVMSQLSYMEVLSESVDTSFVLYGFAKDEYPSSGVDLFVPQILSPNGDGNNDIFVIKGLGAYPNNKLVVFNRYGDVLYEKENYDNSWDGTSNKRVFLGGDDNALPSGTYFVLIFSNGERIYKDFVQLIRPE